MTVMSNETERENGREQKGVVKTEVPIRVHRAKRNSGIYSLNSFRIFFQISSLPIVTNNLLTLLLLNLDIMFLLPSGLY